MDPAEDRKNQMKKKVIPEFIAADTLILQLYVSGMTTKSMEAIENIKYLSEQINDKFKLEIIDIYKNPEVAAEQHIVFSPSLVKQSPLPRKILIGTLSDTEKVVKALGVTFKK
jgi:circadian clock protein KaiB